MTARLDPWRAHAEAVRQLAIDPAADAAAAELAAALRSDALPLPKAPPQAVVLGGAPGADRQLAAAPAWPLVVAGSGARTAHRLGLQPVWLVTDLDGGAVAQAELAPRAHTMVHAHGDNMPLLRHWLPRWPGPLTLTSQVPPPAPAVHVPGFTDGDRAAAILVQNGARSLHLVGFDAAGLARTPKGRIGLAVLAELAVRAEITWSAPSPR